MTGLEVIEIGRVALLTFLMVAGPILGVGMVIGVVIALFQSITQIQEQTLTFVPKILSVFTALLLLSPYMGSLMGDLMVAVMSRIVTSGG